MKPLSRALGHLRKYWLVTCGAYVSLLVVTAGNLATPRLIQVIIDRGISGKNMSVITWAAMGLVALALGRSLFQFAQGYLSERASQGVAFDLRNALYAKIQSLSFSYHDQAQTGQLLTRATNDVELVRMFTGMGFLQLLNSVVMLVGSLVLLFAMNWRLALVAVFILPLVLGLFSVFGLKARPMFSRVQKKLSALNTILQENLAGVRVVKAFAREPFEAERFGKSNRELLDEFLKVGRLMAFLFPTLFLVFNLSTLAIYWYGGFQVMGGDLTVGQLVAFNTYLMMVMMPVGILGMIVTMISRAAASAERIFEILDAQSEVADAPNAQPLPPIEGRVAFEDVRFRYFASSKDRQGEISAPDRSVTGQPAGSRTARLSSSKSRRKRDFPSTEDSKWVLDGVSFVAEPGQTVALLGATGSGKSTIINLIPRFYDVSEGRITMDGHDVRDVTIESLRSQIGIVLQEATLFTGTIRDNLTFGKPEATMEEIVAAAKAAEAHKFIVGFPDGYDTEVGERGVTLSGGQKQRIAIARALLLDPRILILDDSTSSVDFGTEERIQQALDELMKGRTSPSAAPSLRSGLRLRTSFVIAQRISTVLNADQILVLDKGRVVARGTHEELMESSPIYAEIYYSQLHGEKSQT